MPQPLALGAVLPLGNNPRSAFANLKALGLPTAQIIPRGVLEAEMVSAAARDAGIEITSVIAVFDGEDYADIPTITRTVGLVPQESRAERRAWLRWLSEFADQLGVPQVQTHLGFVPETVSDPLYAPLVEETQQICDELGARGQIFALETGQETAGALKQFAADVGRPNLRVNFDPANMILYGNDDPLQALEILFPLIVSVHAKDGKWPTDAQKQAQHLGEETPLGAGDVNFPIFVPRLIELGYRGTLTIEREIEGATQERDVLGAKKMLEGLLANQNL